MSGSEEGKVQELVLIRRRANPDEGGHKGGVWKIAYADFMTAMMAFFLVMWLINSTDKKTLTQVATYFNPLRLTDKKPTPKGLHEPDGSEGAGNAGPSSAKNKEAPAKEKDAQRREEAEPGEVLPRGKPYQHGKQSEAEEARSGTGGQADLSTPHPAGRAFRDPFDSTPRREIAPSELSGGRSERAQPQSSGGAAPQAGRGKAAPSDALRETTRDTADKHSVAGADTVAALDAGKEPAQAAAQPGELAAKPQDGKAISAPAVGAEGSKGPASTEQTTAKEAAAKDAAAPAKEAPVDVALAAAAATGKAAHEKAAREAADKADAAGMEAALRKALAEALPGSMPNVEVTVVPEGVLISLTDDYEFGMFAIASAEPRPAMLVIMAKVAQILQGRGEPLVVRGHTDRRQYRNNATYDNWRLSSARAHVAYQLLARGGIEEKRFERIEGHADRSPRIVADPEAAQNRRIEILLRKRTS